MRRSGTLKGFACLASFTALLAGLTFVPAASADLSTEVLRIDAVNSQGSGSLVVQEADGQWVGDEFIYCLDGPYDLGNGAWIGDPNNPGQCIALRIAHDPQISLDFAMQAGGSTTTFTARSALLSFSTLTNPQSFASVGMNVSDFDGDGATLLATTNGAYLAQYNGFVPGGSTFAQLIDRVDVDPFDSVNADDNKGWEAITGAVSDISTQIEFTLTANDFASGTSSFEVVPEPASGLLLVVGLAALRRR